MLENDATVLSLHGPRVGTTTRALVFKRHPEVDPPGARGDNRSVFLDESPVLLAVKRG